MVVFVEKSMVLYHGPSQRRRITQDGKPSTIMGALSFRAMELVMSDGVNKSTCIEFFCSVVDFSDIVH